MGVISNDVEDNDFNSLYNKVRTVYTRQAGHLTHIMKISALPRYGRPHREGLLSFI
jgi:hypothetical protein